MDFAQGVRLWRLVSRKGRNVHGIASGNTVASLWDEMSALREDHPFIIFCDRDGNEQTYTYGQFHRLTAQTAHLLFSKGIGSGDRVGVHLHDCPEYLMLLFAIQRMGAIAVPVSSDYMESECLHAIECSQMKLVVSDNPGLIRSCVPKGNALEIIGCACPYYACDSSLPTLASLIANEPEMFEAPRDLCGKDPCEILFTSGTTSCPKGIVITHANLVFAGLYGAWQASIGADDRMITPIHANHVYFQTEALYPVLQAGATLVYLQKYSASRFWKQCRKYRATHGQGMATIVRTMMLQKPDAGERDHCMREFLYFLPITDQEKHDFEERFGVRILNLYGATETINACIGDLPLGKRNWPSIGKLGFGYEAKIVDDKGCEVPDGEQGELWVHGEPGVTLMTGYWQDVERTREVLTDDGWYKTGDIAYRTADGWFFYIGRQKETIKTKGENVSPAEIEQVLLSCAGVREAAVIGVPDDMIGCAIEAYVIADEDGGGFVEGLMEECRKKLACYKVPRSIAVCEEFPRSTYGKISKAKLFEMMHGHGGGQRQDANKKKSKEKRCEDRNEQHVLRDSRRQGRHFVFQSAAAESVHA